MTDPKIIRRRMAAGSKAHRVRELMNKRRAEHARGEENVPRGIEEPGR